MRALRATVGAAFTVFGGIRTRTGQTIALIPQYLAGLLWLLSQTFQDLARHGYGQNAAVYACLRLLSQAVPEPPLIAYSVDNTGELKDPLPWDSDLAKLIRTPNELMTEYEMHEVITLHLGIIGRSTWLKERNNAGQIIALWPLRPDRVGPIYSVSPIPGQKVLEGWSYLVPGTVQYVPIARNDVFFCNLADPGGESGGIVEGLGPLQVLATEVGADNEATKFVGALLANYGQPGVVITTTTPIRDPDQAKLIKQAFMQEFGGARRGVPAILDSGADIKPLGFNLKDLEFPGVRAVSESRIAAAFGVPAILVGLKTGLESGIRATISEQREYFAETTLANYWQRISTAFTRDVASEFGDNIVCRFDLANVKALQAQGRYELDRTAEGFAKGAVTVDEYREKVLQLPPIGGDLGASVFMAGNGQFIQAENYVEPNPWLAVSNQADDATDEDQRAIQEAERIARQAAKKPNGTSGPQSTPPANGKPTNGTANGKTLVLARKATTATPRHQQLARMHADRQVQEAADHHEGTIAAYLEALGGHIVQQIQAQGRKAGNEPTIPAGMTQTLHNLLDSLWVDVMAQAHHDAGATLGLNIAYDVTNPEIKNVLDQIANRVTMIDDTTRQEIRDAVDRATSQGQTIDELAKNLRQSHAFSPTRARMISRTETANAYSKGAVMAYKKSGVVSKVHVLDGTDFDDACRAANGQTWELDYAFAHPIEHPNCTRAFAPVVD